MGPNQNPANRSTCNGKFATGCGITGMPTACGIPPLKGWEEVKTVVCFLLFFTGLLLLRRVGLAPETELSSVHAPRREGDRDTRDRIASLLFWVVLFGSLFVAFAVVDWLS